MSYRQKILYLEDVHTDAELVKNVLRESKINFDFLAVDSETEYLMALKDFLPDVVLCDHSLPGFNSFEAFRILKAKKVNVPFIVITSTMTEDLAMIIVRQGADDYIMKDRLTRLPHAIANAVEKYKFEKELKILIDGAHEREIYSNELLSKVSNRILLATSVSGIGIWEYLYIQNKFIADELLLQHYGLAVAEYNGDYEQLLKCVHPEDRSRVKQEFIDKVTHYSNVDSEFRVIWKDGTIHFIKAISAVQRDPSGNPSRLVGTTQDISEQKRSEIRLREAVVQQSLFEAIVQSSDDAIISKTLDGVITSWNHGAEAIFGYTTEETIGENIAIIIPADLINDEKDIVAAAKGGKYIKQYETVRVKKDGSRIDVSLTLSPLLDANGDVIGVSKIARDITERKRAQEQTTNLTNRLLMATNSAKMGIWEWDIENNYLHWDAGMHELYKIDTLEFGSVYEGWLSRLHPEDRDRVNEDIYMAIAGKKGYNTEFRIVWGDLSVHYIRATGMIEKNVSGNATRMIGLNWDVTERRLSEIRLRKLNEDIKKNVKELAESNAELEQFAYVASHDLQEPLRMVTGYLTQIERQYGNIIDEKGKKYIHFAVDGAKRMRQIILDLLEFSRIGRSEESIENIDLNELMVEIRLLFKRQIEEKNACVVSDELPTVPFHRSPLRQVFQNIISNSLKYATEDIQVRIHVGAKELDQHWQFSVTDNGIGIDAEYFDKIFVIFQRLHNQDEFSGTGIGLAITKKIIENMGGKIWIESKEGVGTTFFFTLLKQQ